MRKPYACLHEQQHLKYNISLFTTAIYVIIFKKQYFIPNSYLGINYTFCRTIVSGEKRT